MHAHLRSHQLAVGVHALRPHIIPSHLPVGEGPPDPHLAQVHKSTQASLVGQISAVGMASLVSSPDIPMRTILDSQFLQESAFLLGSI